MTDQRPEDKTRISLDAAAEDVLEAMEVATSLLRHEGVVPAGLVIATASMLLEQHHRRTMAGHPPDPPPEVLYDPALPVVALPVSRSDAPGIIPDTDRTCITWGPTRVGGPDSVHDHCNVTDDQGGVCTCECVECMDSWERAARPRPISGDCIGLRHLRLFAQSTPAKPPRVYPEPTPRWFPVDAEYEITTVCGNSGVIIRARCGGVDAERMTLSLDGLERALALLDGDE